MTDANVTTSWAPPVAPSLRRRLITPKEPIPRRLAVGLGIAAFVLVLAIWAALTYGGAVQPLFLPKPGTVAKAWYDMFAHEDFLSDVWASFWRILVGFLIASALAIPLGIAIGSFRAAQAFFEPIVAAIR